MSNFYLLDPPALRVNKEKICSHVKTILMQRGVEMLVSRPRICGALKGKDWPGLKNGTRADIVLSRKLKSGSRFLVNGVGTHMITASHCETIEKLAVKQDFLRALFLPRLLRCDQCEFPSLRFSIFLSSISMPMTGNPRSEKSKAVEVQRNPVQLYQRYNF